MIDQQAAADSGIHLPEANTGASAPVAASTDRATSDSGTSDTILRQIRLRLPGGARSLVVDVRADSASVFLSGLVRSFYVKQVIYQVCRQCAPGFRVLDETTVCGTRDSPAG